jgi:uncharacterized protein YutE (UPF0331/DUF86 family)
MLNKDFLYRKLTLIQKDLGALETLGEYSFDDFFQDQVVYAAAERYLERIVTRALDMNRHIIAAIGKGTEDVSRYSYTFLRLADLGIYPLAFAEQISQSAGMRNTLVHDYDNVSPRIVYDSVHDALRQYPEYCQYLLTFIDTYTEEEKA